MTKNKTKKHSESFQGKNITLLSGIVIKNDDFFFRKQFLMCQFNCSATCEGLHADVLFETDPLNKMITRGQLDNALEANNGNSKVFKYASKLIKEYRAFKKNMVRGFNFSPTLCKPILVDLIFFTVTLDFTKVHSFRKSFLV